MSSVMPEDNPWPPVEVEPELDVTSSENHGITEPSVIDLLKQEYKELTELEDVYIPVVGYEKVGLQIRYRLPDDGKELDNIGRAVMREFKDNYSRNLYMAIDTMLALCIGLYVQPDTTPEPESLDPQAVGEPVRFDERFVEVMGFTDVDTARGVVKALFGGRGGELAIMSHAEKLQRWMANRKADLSMEFWQVGE